MSDKTHNPIDGSIDMLNSLQLTENMAGLDGASKHVLHNIESLATILKEVIPEYKGYTKEEIMEFIDKDSCNEDMDVSSGRTNTVVQGEATEYQALNEKTSNFDLTFSAKNPEMSKGDIVVRMHYDTEPQKTYRPGYPIEKRGYYYLARRFSAQLSLVLEDTDYNSLEKCYSIFICRDDVPVDERYSVSLYEITNTRNIGKCHPKKEDYDLLTLVLIRLGDKVYNGSEEDEGHDLFEFLNLVMYPHDDNFMDNMKKYIDFSNNPELWKETSNMSGLGQCVYKDGFKDGFKDGSTDERERLNKLTTILIESGRIDDLKRSANDSDYQEELLRKLVPENE